MGGTGRVPALDGLRGVAIVGVIGYHVGFWTKSDVVPGGSYGVTVFFVLSGFLITNLLLAERDRTGGIDRRNFYRRRAARLLPALVVALAFYAVVYAPIRPTWVIAVETAGALCFSYNLLAIWPVAAVATVFWAWSLALEEQFYAVWPSVMRRLNGRRLAALAVGACIIAVALRVLLVWLMGESRFASYSLVTRMDAPMIGALAALAHRRGRRIPAMWVWPALALIAGTYAVGAESRTVFPWWLAVVAVASAVAVLASISGGAAAFLCSPTLRWLGDRSYGLYLWHSGCYAFVALYLNLTGWGGATVAVAATGLVATASYRWIERPARRWARGETRRGPSCGPEPQYSTGADAATTTSKRRQSMGGADAVDDGLH
jgi:peptidoglycan/LPS O-acetylase OafA/YrhL